MTATTNPPTESRPVFMPPEWDARRTAVLKSKLHRDLKRFAADAERLIDAAFALATRVEDCPPAVNPFGTCPGTSGEGLIGEAAGELEAIARTVNNAVAFFRGEL